MKFYCTELIIQIKMYKQKQQQCCCHRKRNRCLRHSKTTRKNRRILQTYVVDPVRIRASTANSMYEVIQKQKLEAMKKKQSDQYLIINPNVKYCRNIKTQNSELQEEYLSELKNIKDEIKSLQKDIDIKKTLQMSSRPIQLRPIINLNPQHFERKSKSKQHRQRQYPTRRESIRESRRLHSVNNFYQDDLDQLRDQVRHIRREITIDKRLKNSFQLPSIQRYDPYRHYLSNTRNTSVNHNQTPTKKQQIFISSPSKSKLDFNTQLSWRKKKQSQVKRKIKKVVNAIFFTVYLRKFSEKIRLKRQNFFKETHQQNFLYQIAKLRKSFVKSTTQLVQTLPITQSKSLIITSIDNEKQREIRISLTRKYLNSFLDIISETQFLPNMVMALTQTCYFICRHGGAGISSNYFTAEQLDIMSVSKFTLKISAEKNLQKSQIISFIWIKLIVFNVLLRTQVIQELSLQNNAIWNSNFYLMGSLVYQICRNIQLTLLQRTPTNYVVGNWKHINFLNSKRSHTKKSINPCKSMVIAPKTSDKSLNIQESPNQLIQGTVSKGYLSEAYNFESWDIQQRKIYNFVNFIHRKMCKYHAKLKEELI